VTEHTLQDLEDRPRREKRVEEKMSVFVKKFISQEEMKRLTDSKHRVFFVGERNLPRYPWIEKAISESWTSHKLNRPDKEQFYEISGRKSRIILVVTHNGLSVKALYLLTLVDGE